MSGLVDRLVSASAAAALAATLLIAAVPIAKAHEDVWPTLKQANFDRLGPVRWSIVGWRDLAPTRVLGR
jgi:hypothetical protein